MAKIQTLVGLLRLLQASDGEIETRIRLQKEAYLLSLRYPALFNANDFEYHHYGPYSRFLSDTLQFAVLSNLVDEIDETPDDMSFTKYRYRLTEKGKSAASEMSPDDNYFYEFVKRLSKENWRTLELSSTIKYLELKESIDRELALDKATKLKPATAPFKGPALKLLQDAHL